MRGILRGRWIFRRCLCLKNKEALHAFRDGARANPQSGVEGVMLKRLDSPYIAGRPRGYWFKWKRNTLTLDCVLLYAQRGSGKRSSFYSDYTFGVWHEDKLCRSAKPIRVSPMKSFSGSTNGSGPTRSIVSGRCAR